MRFRLLGGLAVEDPEKTAALGGPKQRAVLAALLIEPRQPLSAAALADRIWGDDLPVRYQTSIQAYVSNLRRHLEPDRSSRTPATVLVSRAAGYAMDVDDAEIDASHFRSLVERVHQLRRAGHAAEEVLGVIDQAMACWSGPLLPELAGRAWVDVPATALLEQRRQILVAKTELLVETGAPGEALVAAEMALTDSAYDEHLHGLVAICRYQMGNQRQALAGLQDVRRLLADEIGVNPGPEFQQVEHDILAHHPRLSPPEHRSGSTPPVVAPPLPADSAPTNSATLAVRPFVGRTDELARLRSARTKAHAGIGHFIIVRGEAGIGKSRLIDQFVHEDNNDTVAWGRCPETSAQASYWVCSQIVRQLEGAEVIDAVPLLTLAAQSINAGFDAFDSRWSFYRATVDALAKVKRPVTVVVDDLQYADPASLRLIGFLAGEITTMPVLVVVIVRPITAHDSIELIDCLAEIGRLPDTERIDLGGLTVDDIGALLAEMIGHRPNTGIVESV
ncbi:MAG TPA: BTAD domain-containing putative transcriptional regulator, partial [Ilumatobacteraceae bacterium]|nr:BTAD domain-containing putative transcriptional regulator [Ilumatobacteraceae bacterium]